MEYFQLSGARALTYFRKYKNQTFVEVTPNKKQTEKRDKLQSSIIEKNGNKVKIKGKM